MEHLQFPVLGVPASSTGLQYLPPDTLRDVAAPTTAVLAASAFDVVAQPKVGQASFTAFFGLPDYQLCLYPRPVTHGQHKSAPSTDSAISCDAFQGRATLTSAAAMEAARESKALVVSALLDPVSACEPPSKKRRVCMSRSTTWENECSGDVPVAYTAFHLLEDEDEEKAPRPTKWRSSPWVFVQTALGETPQVRKTMLSAVRQGSVPEAVFLCTAGSVSGAQELLSELGPRCVVSVPFVFELAERGLAVRSPESDEYLNLWDDGVALCKDPVMEGCDCPCCRRHTQGYLYHLLRLHEMNAQLLLAAHNLSVVNRTLAAHRK